MEEVTCDEPETLFDILDDLIQPTTGQFKFDGICNMIIDMLECDIDADSKKRDYEIGRRELLYLDYKNPCDVMAGASEGGHMYIIKDMIKKGANNWHECFHAALRGDHKDIIEFMKDNLPVYPNTAVGYGGIIIGSYVSQNMGGTNNIVIGYNALQNTSGTNGTAIGHNALQNMARHNTTIGGHIPMNGNDNTAIGSYLLRGMQNDNNL